MKKYFLQVTLSLGLIFGLSLSAHGSPYSPAQETVFQKKPDYTLTTVHCIEHPEDCDTDQPEEDPQTEPETPAENPEPTTETETNTNTAPAQPTDTAEVPLGSANNGGCQMAPGTVEGMGLNLGLPFLISAAGLGITRVANRKRGF